MGQQIIQAMNFCQAASANVVPTAQSGTGLPELLSPAEAAKALGIGEADVLNALAEGSLKGKKIGSAWRITRTGLEEFIKS